MPTAHFTAMVVVNAWQPIQPPHHRSCPAFRPIPSAQCRPTLSLPLPCTPRFVQLLLTSLSPDVSNMSNVRCMPATEKFPWCISSIVRLYLDEKLLYKNCDITELLPTFSPPITTILWRKFDDDAVGVSSESGLLMTLQKYKKKRQGWAGAHTLKLK